MCIAIPYGKNKVNESRLWYIIRTRPLYMLSLGALILLLFLAIFWLTLNNELLSSSKLFISATTISAYHLLFGISGFLFFAICMHVYPKKMHSGDIEYPYYGAFFFLTLYNSAFFYFAVFNGFGLIITSIIIQLFLLFFAFKPLWRAYCWSNKQNRRFGMAVNSVFALIVLSQLIFLILLFF